ncbi:MAG: type II toxin-antitoxin system VapC family toxin [Luteolibacter sp.]
MLIDTDVLIWCLRGNEKAAKALNLLHQRWISDITRMELIVGCKNKTEITLLKRFLSDGKFRIIPISSEIGTRATIYLEDWHLSHSLGLPDALIAATAALHGQQLFTANYKHFRCIPGLELKRFSP